MMPGQAKEQIAQELVERASGYWGVERAEDLRSKIEQTASWLSLIAQATLEIDEDEPDFLVAPAVRGEKA